MTRSWHPRRCVSLKSFEAVRVPRWLVWCSSVLLAASLAACEPKTDGNRDPASPYVYRTSEHPDGTGKFYLDREIAPVTEHEGAGWLERPDRAVSEFPDRLVQAIDLRPTDVVADIGAGTGYFTFRLSPRVPQGRVLAVDIQPEMLDEIEARLEAEAIENVETILGTPQDPNLPANSIDVALIVVSYHEFSHPREMMEHIVEALRPGGRLVLVEYRGEDPTLQVDALHRMSEAQARREMEAVGLVWNQTKDVLPQQHLMIFEKPPE